MNRANAGSECAALLVLSLCLSAVTAQAATIATYVVRDGETLMGIAAAHHPERHGATVVQMAWAIRSANPGAFPAGTSPRAGAVLNIPDAKTVLATSHEVALENLGIDEADLLSPAPARAPPQAPPPASATAPSPAPVAVVGSNPVITDVSPNPVKAVSGTRPFTITGTGFLEGATLRFADLTRNRAYTGRAPESVTATKLVRHSSFGITPAHWLVMVENPDGSISAPFHFEVGETVPEPEVSKPVITGVSPNPVPADSGTRALTITGTGFQPGATLEFVDLTRDRTYSDRVPESVTGTTLLRQSNFGRTPASWRVSVHNPDGGVSEPFRFDVRSVAVDPNAPDP